MKTRSRMSREDSRWQLCLLLCLIAFSCSGALLERRRDKSDDFFESGVVPELRIEITGTNLTQLRRQQRNYVRATVRDGERVYQDVGIHLKGAAGSWRELDDRPALSLNFDKFRDGQ